MLRNNHKLASILVILFASFFSFNSVSHALSNDVIAFGDLGNFSNPSHISRFNKQTASLNFYHLIYNNAIPVLSYYSNFKGPYFQGGDSFAQGIYNYEVNFGFKNFGFGYNLAEERYYAASGDTIRAIQDFQNNSHVVGKTYDVGISGREEKKEYFKFYLSAPVKTKIVKSLWLGACFNIINGISYGSGTLTGHATQVDATTTQFDFDVDADHTEKNTHGNGFSLDLGTACQVNEKLSFEMILENIMGIMNWHNVANTTATGKSENVIIDANGNIINNPTITGSESVKNFSEIPNFKSLWGVKYNYNNNLSFLSILEPYSDVTYYYVGSEWSPYNTYNIRFGYESKYEATSIGVEWKFIKCILFTNNLSLSSATSLGMILCGTI